MRTLVSFLVLLPALASAQANWRWRAPKLAQLANPAYTAGDVQAEIEFGRGLAARILHNHPLVKDRQLHRYLNVLGTGLAAQVGRPELRFYFGAISTDDVNAYACPGGYIFLTRGLMRLLRNEAELVGVLAHEIAHVNERHVIKKLQIKGKDDSTIAGLGALVGGATASFRMAVKVLSDEAMNLLFDQGLMSSEELDSDKLAIRTLHANGYRVGAYQDLLARLGQSAASGQARVLRKTHPSTQDRQRLVQAFLSNTPTTATLVNEERFNLYARP